MTLPSNTPSPSWPLASILCCPELYQHPLVLGMLGEGWHPGGLSLTQALVNEIELSRGDHLLDVACGRGASALMLAQGYQCRVAGVDLSAAAIQQAQKEAYHCRSEDLVTFIQGDATRLPFASSTFSAALCECATSLFPDRPSAFSEIARVLQPAGYFALSDVTFRPTALPKPIDIPLARALCIPLGMGPEAYVRLAEEAGFIVERQLDCSSAVAQLLDKIESLLGMARLAAVGGESDGEPLSRLTGALHCARELLQQEDLGYWAFVSRRR